MFYGWSLFFKMFAVLVEYLEITMPFMYRGRMKALGDCTSTGQVRGYEETDKNTPADPMGSATTQAARTGGTSCEQQTAHPDYRSSRQQTTVGC